MQKKTSSTSSQKKLNSEWTDRQVGSFWIQEREGDSSYLLGNVEIDGKKVLISIFKNKFSDSNSKSPQFVAFKNFSKNKVEDHKSKN